MRRGNLAWISCGMTLVCSLFIPLGLLVAQEQPALDVTVGHSHIIRTTTPVGTIALGDPEIADATAAAGGTIIVTGKAVGITNMIGLDEKGEEIFSYRVQVVPVDRPASFSIRLVRGGHPNEEFEYSCGPGPLCRPSRRTEDAAAASSYTFVVGRPDEPRSSVPESGGATANSPRRVSPQ